MKAIKNIQGNFLYLLVVLTTLLLSCEKEKAPNDKGFSEEIKNFVPDSTMQKMKDLGMVIHEGKVPPKLEGIFIASPLIMRSTSVPEDGYSPGHKFIDYYYKFYNQDNKKLAISLNTQGVNSKGEAITTSTGNGAFISGNKNNFTIFVVLDEKAPVNENDTAFSQSLEVISGTISPEGIVNFHSALWMLDTYGDPYEMYIPVNTGRVFYDSDSLASRTYSMKMKSSNGMFENSNKSLLFKGQRPNKTSIKIINH